MNFTFLVILSLLTLGFTYETLKISQKQLTIIILVLLILLVSYNVKETFQAQTTAAIDASNSLVLDNMDGNVTEELKSTYLEQAPDLVTISNDLVIHDIKDTEYLSELVEKLQGLQTVGAKFHFIGANLTRLDGFNNLTRVSNFINTDLTADGSVVARNYEWYSNPVRTHVKFAVSSNDLLTNINGFNSLINTNFIFITRNNQLKTIEGFSSIRKINALYISGNDSLESVKGFENLEIIDGQLILDIINLKELQPFTKLKTVTRGVALLGELFNDPDFDIDYYFPELTSTGILLSHNMSGNLLTKFRARPGFIESETPSPRALTLDNIREDSDEAPKKFFLFNGSPIQRIRNFFNMDTSESVINHINLRSEVLNLKLS